MDLVLDLIATLSRWCRGNLYDISLAIMATLFVLFGPGINAWVQKSISGLNFVLRTLIFVLVCAIGYGLRHRLPHRPGWPRAWATSTTSPCRRSCY